jgi:hypothetical protein
VEQTDRLTLDFIWRDHVISIDKLNKSPSRRSVCGIARSGGTSFCPAY